MKRLGASDPIERRLTGAEKAAVRAALEGTRVASPHVIRRAVDEAIVVGAPLRQLPAPSPRGLIAYVALRRRADGITLGRRIYIRRGLFGEAGELPVDLLAHEVAHVAQVLRDGLVPFLVRYGAAYLAGRLRGLSDHGAYLAIPYEEEARRAGVRAAPRDAGVRALR